MTMIRGGDKQVVFQSRQVDRWRKMELLVEQDVLLCDLAIQFISLARQSYQSQPAFVRIIFVVCILLCVMYTLYTIGSVQHKDIFGRNNKIDTNVSTLLFLFIAHATCFDPYCWVIIRRVKNASLS
jgi:hypothetical protein